MKRADAHLLIQRAHTDITTYTGERLDQLCNGIRHAVDRDQPTTIDGYPTRTSGSDPGTSSSSNDPDPVELTSVEAATIARQHQHRDAHHHHTEAALGYLNQAANSLRAAANHLAHIENLTRPRTGNGEGLDPDDWCWHHLRLNAGIEPVWRNGLCRRCSEWRYQYGELPPKPIMTATRLTEKLVEQHRPRRTA